MNRQFVFYAKYKTRIDNTYLKSYELIGEIIMNNIKQTSTNTSETLKVPIFGQMTQIPETMMIEKGDEDGNVR